MTGLRSSPRLLKAGLCQVHPETGALLSRVVLQYNPDQVTRTLQLGGAGEHDLGPLRARVPPVETLKIECELDASDAMERGQGGGIAAQIAALEGLATPRSADLRELDRLAARGTLEILAPEPPLTLFVWSARRIIPVRITELAITEEAFDPELAPIRARVSLGMRALSAADLGMGHRGGGLAMVYLRSKERLAASLRSGELPLFTGRELG
ncbi:MAG: hypothetical protein R3B09_13175 [Nannocystaceae bacterium]